MPALDSGTASMILGALAGLNSWTASVTPLNLRLTISTPTAAVAATELSGPGYTAGGKNVTFGNLATTSTGAAMTNTNALTWTNNGSAVWVIVGLEIWDSSGTPVRKAYGLWDNQPIQIGPGSQFPVAALAVTWAIP